MTAVEQRIERKLDRLTDLVLGREIGVREVSRRLGISVREVQRRAKSGRLRAIPESRPYRFFLSDVVGKF